MESAVHPRLSLQQAQRAAGTEGSRLTGGMHRGQQAKRAASPEGSRHRGQQAHRPAGKEGSKPRGQQAQRAAGTQAKRAASPEGSRHTGPQAKRAAGTEGSRHTGQQAQRASGTEGNRHTGQTNLTRCCLPRRSPGRGRSRSRWPTRSMGHCLARGWWSMLTRPRAPCIGSSRRLGWLLLCHPTPSPAAQLSQAGMRQLAHEHDTAARQQAEDLLGNQGDTGIISMVLRPAPHVLVSKAKDV